MAEDGKSRIEKFNEQKFAWWKMQMEDVLYQKDVYKPLQKDKPKDINDAEWKILDRKALATVRLCLSSQVAFTGNSIGEININVGRVMPRGLLSGMHFILYVVVAGFFLSCGIHGLYYLKS